MALKPVIGGPGFYNQIRAGAPALPVWTYVSGGEPSAGQFSSDVAPISGTTTITINGFAKYGTGNWPPFLTLIPDTISVYFIFTDSAGAPSVFSVQSSMDTENGRQFTVTNIVAGSGAWNDLDYQLSFAPAAPTLASVLATSGITPAGNGEQTPVTSLTTQSGIVTAKS